jgi:hypothetical protein
MLSAFSPVLRIVLLNNKLPLPFIDMIGDRQYELHYLLHFIFHGEVAVIEASQMGYASQMGNASQI